MGLYLMGLLEEDEILVEDFFTVLLLDDEYEGDYCYKKYDH
jgi:hypothetical protein